MVNKTQYFIRAIHNTSSAGNFKLFHSSSIIFSDLSTETRIEELELEKRVKFLKTFASDLDKSESKTLEKVNELENLNDSISSYSESFSNVDPNDPFFGILPKILKSIVTNEEIPLAEILEEKGLFLGSIYLLNKYPISTIFATKKGIVITDKEIEVITELKDKIENIETRINTLENKTKVFEELDNKLNELANRSIMAIKAVDKGDIALLGLQFVSPFLIYRGILNTYGKLVIDNTYKPKNIEEQKYIEKNRIRLINRFNRIGIPILLVSYLTVSQINIEKKNKAIIQSMKDTIFRCPSPAERLSPKACVRGGGCACF
jgi:chaperonin cofactor prefoldin